MGGCELYPVYIWIFLNYLNFAKPIYKSLGSFNDNTLPHFLCIYVFQMRHEADIIIFNVMLSTPGEEKNVMVNYVR